MTDDSSHRSGEQGRERCTSGGPLRRDVLRTTAGVGTVLAGVGAVATNAWADHPVAAPPENVSVTTTASSLTVTWDESSSATGNAVRLRTGGLTWTSDQIDGTSLTVDRPPVVPGTTYEVQIGVPYLDEYVWSSGTTATTPAAPAGAPATPTNLTVEASTETSLALSWAAGGDATAVDHFEVAHARVDDGSLGSFSRSTSTESSASLSGLTESTYYRILVWAVDADGNVSGAARLTTSTTGDWTAPPAPTDLSATVDADAGIVTVSWTGVTDEGTSGLDHYEVSWRTAQDFGHGRPVIGTVTPGTGTTTATIDGLSTGQRYEISVVAIDAAENRSDTSTLVVDAASQTGTSVIAEQSFAVLGTSSTSPANAADVSIAGTNGRQVSVTGAIVAPTPCHTAVLDGAGFDGSRLSLTVKTVDESSAMTACTDVLAGIDYEATFVLGSSPSEVVIVHQAAGGEWQTTWTSDGDSLPPVEGGLPRDLDGDGTFEDVNGNNRTDNDDVVTYFEHMDDPAITDHTAAYDYNGNGRIDFDDLVTLFEAL